jgi:hypothetical protein
LAVELGIQIKFRGKSYLTNHREVSPRAQLCLFNFPTLKEYASTPRSHFGNSTLREKMHTGFGEMLLWMCATTEETAKMVTDLL